jgi:hypothetical protein
MGDADDARAISEAVELVSGVGGALGAAAMSLIAGPFVGGPTGVLVARVLRRAGLQVQGWVLTSREQHRIEEAVEAAAESMAAHRAGGGELRMDGFFDEASDGAESPADELLEGVLRTASAEWEGRKVPYYGRLFAGVSFDTTVSPAEASYLLRLANRLTYRQVALLAFWERVQRPVRAFGQAAVVDLTIHAGEPGNTPRESVVAEMDELAAANLLGVAADGDVARVGSTFGSSGGFAGVEPNKVRLTGLGATLHRLMELDRIPDDELTDQILSALQGKA